MHTAAICKYGLLFLTSEGHMTLKSPECLRILKCQPVGS